MLAGDQRMVALLLFTSLCVGCVGLALYALLAHIKRLSGSTAKPSDTSSSGGVTLTALFALFKPYFWPDGGWDRAWAAASWSNLLLSRVCSTCGPLLMGHYAHALGSGVYANAPVLSLAVIACTCFCYLGKVVFEEAMYFFYLKVKFAAKQSISVQVVRHLFHQDTSYHESHKADELSSALDRGIRGVDTIVNYGFIKMLPNILDVLSMSLILWTSFQQGVLALSVLLSLLPYSFVTVVATSTKFSVSKSANSQALAAVAGVVDALRSITSVKLSCGEEYESGRYTAGIAGYSAASTQAWLIQQIGNVGKQAVFVLVLGIGLFVCGQQVADGTLPQAQLVAICMCIIQVYRPLNSLDKDIAQISNSYVDLQGVLSILTSWPTVVDPTTPVDVFQDKDGPVLALDRVTFGYDGKSNQLMDVSLSVEPGEVVAITGRNGAGKSTLLSLISRLRDVSSGRVLVNGADVRGVRQVDLRTFVLTVNQQARLMARTVRENLTYGLPSPAPSDSELESALSRMGLSSAVCDLCTMLGDGGTGLSPGERQRLVLARTLLRIKWGGGRRPRLLVLDECTSGVDSAGSLACLSLLAKECAEVRTALLLVAHSGEVVCRLASRVCMLEGGRVVLDGPLSSLKSHPRFVAQFGQHSK